MSTRVLGSVAVGAPADEINIWQTRSTSGGRDQHLADEINIVPTRRANSAGASSMIESASISVCDAARGDKTSAGGGSCTDEAAVVLVVAAMTPMIRPEPTALHSMVSGLSSASTGPQPRGRPRPAHRHRLHSHRHCAAWAMRESAVVTAAGSS